MQSQQAPRRIRLQKQAEQEKLDRLKQQSLQALLRATSPNNIHQPTEEQDDEAVPTASTEETRAAAESQTSEKSRRRLSLSDPHTIQLLKHPPSLFHPTTTNNSSTTGTSTASGSQLPALKVRCEVRTRIPTPHGHIFLHLYTNNQDDKEHLAFVADQAQMDSLHPATDIGTPSLPFIRSESLDAEWRPHETEMERIVRGAYMGKLTADTVTPSTPIEERNFMFGHHSVASTADSAAHSEPPLVRIHSECFTGEVIGSQRCDCGEQLDEAFRLITLQKRGIVVYLRQEGRGIGLLEKMRAYNLQDLGHDTVTANLMLGHGADMRTYGIAGAILRDLHVSQVKLLTNNPDKIESITREGIRVVQRVEMIPRSWIRPKKSRGAGKAAGHKPVYAKMSGEELLRIANEKILRDLQSKHSNEHPNEVHSEESETESEAESENSFHSSDDSAASHNLRRSGVGMIGASVTRSAELDKYLKTKIERMGHLLNLPQPSSSVVSNAGSTRANSRAESPAPNSPKTRHRHQHKITNTSKRVVSEGASIQHPLASSIVSDSAENQENSVDCGASCEECEGEDAVIVE